MAPSYLFPNRSMSTTSLLMPISALATTLQRFLSRNDLMQSEVIGALEEFAFRNLVDGTRVRDYCGDVAKVLGKLYNQHTIQYIISTTYLHLLFPLVPPHDPNSPAGVDLTAPDALLNPSQLATISRKQFIDVLASQSKGRLAASGFNEDAERQVLEVCLEYIGRRWRGGSDGKEENLAEGIGKKLTEVEFEMQLLGFPPTTRSVLIPILHQIRYSLGFITPSQLVTQLNTQHNPERTDREIFEPMHLVTNWLTVRLRARLNPADLVSDLVNMREQLYDHSHRACIYEVLSLFGLSQRGMSTQESVLGHGPPSSISLTPIEHDMSASFFSMSPTKTRSPFVLKHKPSLRRTMPSTPKWWSHRRNNSASSRANHLGLLNFNTDRRPSLPVTSSPSLLHTSNYHPSGINGIKAFHQSSSSLATSTSAASTEKTVSTANLLSTLMTYNDPEDIRVILLDHFLGLKFHLSPSDSATDWYLGNGISMAEDTAISLENTMVGNKDVMKLQPIFNQIRDVFNLPRPRSSSKRSSYRPKQRLADDLVKQFPHCPPRRDSILGSSDLNHHRNVSFDLEGYIAESTEDGSGETVKDSLDKVFSPEAKDEVAQPSIPGLKSKTKNKHPSLSIAVTDRPKTAASRSIKRRSAGAESTLTMATMFSDTTGLNAGGSSRSGHGHHRFSLMSNFTIREATREYASEAIASRFCLPRRVNSLSTLDYIDHYIPTPTASTFDDYDASIRGQSRFSDDSDRTSLFRASLGEPINVEPLSPDRISTWESYEVTNWSQSEPNLLEFLGTSPDCHSDSPHSHFYRELEMGEDPHDSTYTRLPARMTVGSLRRRSRIKAPWELQLSAYDLGLEDKVSRRQSSSTPRLIPGQSYQDSMMDDQLAKAPVQSYVVNGLDTPPNSPPLDIDITSFIDHQNMTVESSFSHANFTQGPISRVSTPVLPETPVQESKDQRQLHRQWTIFNGEHVSPPKTVLPLPERVLQRPRFPRSKSSPGPELGGSRQFDTTTPSKVASPAMTSPADPVTAKPLPNPPKQFADTSGTSHFDQVRVSPFDNVQVKPSRPRFFRSQSSPGPEVGLSKRSDQTTFSPVIPPRTSSRFSPVVLGALSHLPERVVNTSSTQVPGQVLVEVVRLFQVDSTLGIVRPRSGVTRAEVDQVIKAIKEKHPYGTGDWIVQEIEALLRGGFSANTSLPPTPEHSTPTRPDRPFRPVFRGHDSQESRESRYSRTSISTFGPVRQ